MQAQILSLLCDKVIGRLFRWKRGKGWKTPPRVKKRASRVGRPLFWLASEVEEPGAAYIDGAHRAHLMAAVAVNAPVVPDLRLAAYDGDGMRRTALGTASAADTVLPADHRA